MDTSFKTNYKHMLNICQAQKWWLLNHVQEYNMMAEARKAIMEAAY